MAIDENYAELQKKPQSNKRICEMGWETMTTAESQWN